MKKKTKATGHLWEVLMMCQSLENALNKHLEWHTTTDPLVADILESGQGFELHKDGAVTTREPKQECTNTKEEIKKELFDNITDILEDYRDERISNAEIAQKLLALLVK